MKLFSFCLSHRCYSQYVGQNGGKQEISIGHDCEKTDIVLHEILHALGFWHVQSRTDRDDYVTVHYENIESGKFLMFKPSLLHCS